MNLYFLPTLAQDGVVRLAVAMSWVALGIHSRACVAYLDLSVDGLAP